MSWRERLGRNWGRLGMKFDTIKLSELAEIQTGPFGSQLHKEDYVVNGTPIVTVEHLGNRKFTEQNLPCVSDKDKERLKKYMLKTGDIVFSRVGSVDRCSYVSAEYEGWMFSGRCLRVRPCEILNSEYLYYFFSLKETKQFVRNIATGATMPSINTKFMGEVPIRVPSMEAQNKIASILWMIDDKIELNEKINNNLEQQAQTLFDNFYDSLSGQSCILSEIIDISDGTHDSPKATEHGYPLVTSKHLLPFGVDTSSANIISKADYDKVNERSKVNTGDILISMIGTVGLISYVIDSPVEFAIKNVGLFKTSKHPSLDLYILYYLKNKSTTQHIEKCLAGSTQKYISLGELRKLPIVVPSPDELAAYNLVVRPIVSEIALLMQENRRLSNLRDTLLPKLMSGELDVSGLDI